MTSANVISNVVGALGAVERIHVNMSILNIEKMEYSSLHSIKKRKDTKSGV